MIMTGPIPIRRLVWRGGSPAEIAVPTAGRRTASAGGTIRRVCTDMTRFELKRGVAKKLTWSRPDSRIAPFCSLCQAHIPAEAVPLMMWDGNGACVQFCDDCADNAIVAIP